MPLRSKAARGALWLLARRQGAAQALLLRVRSKNSNHCIPSTCVFTNVSARRRQKAVCLGQDDSRKRYEALFDSPSANELEQQFKSIVGDTYDSIPPAMLQAFKDADTSETGYNQAAASLCDGGLKDSMSLDEVCYKYSNRHTLYPTRWNVLTGTYFGLILLLVVDFAPHVGR